jgi:hypothetical protein
MVIQGTICSAIRKIKRGTKSSASTSSKPGPSSYSQDTTSSSKAKTCTWHTKYHPSKGNTHGWQEYSKLKEFNKSVPKDTGKVKVQHVSTYNPDFDSEVEGLIDQDAEVSTTTKWIFDSGAPTHMTLDAALFRDIWPIRSEVRLGNGVGILIIAFVLILYLLF